MSSMTPMFSSDFGEAAICSTGCCIRWRNGERLFRDWPQGYLTSWQSEQTSGCAIKKNVWKSSGDRLQVCSRPIESPLPRISYLIDSPFQSFPTYAKQRDRSIAGCVLLHTTAVVVQRSTSFLASFAFCKTVAA